MIRELRVLQSHGRQFIKDLRNQPVSERFRGRPVIAGDISGDEIKTACSVCPVNALSEVNGSIDLGKCTFCNECALVIPGKISFKNDYRIAVNRREDLVILPGQDVPLRINGGLVRKDIRKNFRQALKLRQVSAAGDNSCEMELAATGNVNFDLGRYGIEFVASPRHADGIVITGPISENMSVPLQLTWEAVPAPKIIILAGTDAISGGIFKESPALNRQFIENQHIDLFVPGNPAHPLTFINGVMDLLDIR